MSGNGVAVAMKSAARRRNGHRLHVIPAPSVEAIIEEMGIVVHGEIVKLEKTGEFTAPFLIDSAHAQTTGLSTKFTDEHADQFLTTDGRITEKDGMQLIVGANLAIWHRVIEEPGKSPRREVMRVYYRPVKDIGERVRHALRSFQVVTPPATANLATANA